MAPPEPSGYGRKSQLAGTSVTTTWAPNNKPGGVVTVVVSYNFPPLTSLVSSVTIPLTRTAAMVISQ